MPKELLDTKQSMQDQDLGLGFRVIQNQKTRFINRDGTFNVYKKSAFGRGWFSMYHAILAMSWFTFMTWVSGLFLTANAIFAAAYQLTGPAAFPVLSNIGAGQRYVQLFLYSVQILTTLGASPLHPATVWGNVVLDIEAALGLLGFAVATGLILARISNPSTKIMFSDKAVIAPYKDITGLMFRIINGRSNELIEVTAAVTLVIIDGSGQRQFQQLALEREMVLVFPLNWTVVHPIDEKSPLWGLNAESLAKANAEFIIIITAIDKDLDRKVYARFSYWHDELIFGARFVTMIEQSSDGTVVTNPSLLDKIERV